MTGAPIVPADMTAAVILNPSSAIEIGGLTLTERAILLAHKAGLGPIFVAGESALPARSAARLRARGVSVVHLPIGGSPLGEVPDGEVILIQANVLFGPGALSVLTSREGAEADGASAVADSAGIPVLLDVPVGALRLLRTCGSFAAIAARLAEDGTLSVVPRAGLFCERLTGPDTTEAIERSYIRHLNGRGEGYFTKKIRIFSVPLTSRLVRMGARPTHVTLGGLALAVLSSWSIAQGSYGAGVTGGVLYYASMVCDCSDGEVARLTVRDDPFGAWLETMVDYSTYFLILGALTLGSQSRSGAAEYRTAAMVALVGSIVVALVASYLRHRVAAADPGQFDDASASALATASRIHRFARWGRQWIKRSTMAHLVLALALVNQLPALLYLWAFGATLAALVILAVEPFVVRRVAVRSARIRRAHTDS